MTDANANTSASPQELYARIKDLCKHPNFFAGHDEVALQTSDDVIKWHQESNRVCGDSITLAVRRVSSTGSGGGYSGGSTMVYAGYFCAICQSQAELICQHHNTGPSHQRLAEIAGLIGAAKRLPMRQKCASLAHEALAALGFDPIYQSNNAQASVKISDDATRADKEI